MTSRLKRRGSPATLRMPRSSVLEKARAESCHSMYIYTMEKARAESCRGSAIASTAIVSAAIVSTAIVSTAIVSTAIVSTAIVSAAIVSTAIVSIARGAHLPWVGGARLGIAHTQGLDVEQIHALVLVASAASAAAAAALCRHLEALDQASHHE